MNYVMGRDGDLPIRFNLDSSFRLSIANNFGYVDIYSGGLLAVSMTYGIFTVDELAYLNNNSLVIETHDKQRNIKQFTQLLPKLECLGTNYRELCALILNGLYYVRGVITESCSALTRISHLTTAMFFY